MPVFDVVGDGRGFLTCSFAFALKTFYLLYRYFLLWGLRHFGYLPLFFRGQVGQGYFLFLSGYFYIRSYFYLTITSKTHIPKVNSLTVKPVLTSNHSK